MSIFENFSLCTVFYGDDRKPNTKKVFFSNMLLAFSSQAEVISPSEELLNNQVINDFDIEEEEIQIENRYVHLFNDIESKRSMSHYF